MTHKLLALKKEELLRRLTKENQSSDGGDKSRVEALMSKSSTADEQSGTVRKAVAKEAGISEGTLFMY